MKTKILSALYFLLGITFIVLRYVPGLIPQLVVKSLLMPLLLVILVINIKDVLSAMHRFMILALLFAWAGDILLEFSRTFEMMFMAGLLCFMLTQVFYFVVFSQTPGEHYALKKYYWFILPVYLYGAILLTVLYRDLGEMRIPVILYTLVILTMLAAAVNRIGKVSRISFNLVVYGAALFVLSDSMIAVNKFYIPFKASSALIMITYISGQFLIIMGYIKQHRTQFI